MTDMLHSVFYFQCLEFVDRLRQLILRRQMPITVAMSSPELSNRWPGIEHRKDRPEGGNNVSTEHRADGPRVGRPEWHLEACLRKCEQLIKCKMRKAD